MAIIETKLKEWSGGGNVDITKGKVERDYTCIFQVVSNDCQDGPYIICTAPGIPRPGETYAYGYDLDAGARCQKAEAKRDKKSSSTNNVWLVTCSFSTKIKDTDKNKFLDPTLEPVEFSWGSGSVQEVAEYDIYGAAIKNSAGQKFDPPVEKETKYITIQATRNEYYFDDIAAAGLINKVNSTTFWGHAARHIWLTDISGNTQSKEKQNSDGTSTTVRYVKITYSFSVCPYTWGWQKKILDQGMQYKNNAGEVVLATDGNGNIHSEKILLTSSGTKLPAGGTENWLYKDILYETDLNSLGLPDPWRTQEI